MVSGLVRPVQYGRGLTRTLVDRVHESLIHHRRLKAHLRRAVVSNSADEISIHCLIPAHVAKARQEQAWHAATPHEDERTMRLKRDDAFTTEQL